MKRSWMGICLAFWISFTLTLAQRVEVREEVLSNGMKLLLVERHDSPTIAAGWVARVGSVNERPGITGISHLFEHMMFKGTKTIGIKDYEKDLEILRQQDAVRAKMEEQYAKLREKKRKGEISGNIYDPENMTPELKRLRQELEALFKKEAELIVKDELDQIYTREGGSGLNAFTSNDQTAYIITIPSNKLELWFWLESDRLLNPVFREFYSERDVVREERRMRTESTPTGKLDELFEAMFWQSSPYLWPVVGWPSDVESITRDQAERYFDTYYAPNNITAVLVGDLDSDAALELAEQYLGRIPRGENPVPPVVTEEVEQLGEKRFVAEADTNPQVAIRYHTVPFNHKDMFALEILAEVLSGRTGRLYKSLVEEKDLAVGQPYASVRNMKYEGYLQVGAEVKEGRDPAQVESALLAELQKLKDEPVGENELQKVKNKEMADSFRRLQNNFFLLLQLMIYDSNDGWEFLNEAPEKIQAVTAEQVQEAAAQYLSKENRNLAVYLRKAGASAEPPELSGLPPQFKAFVMQQLAQIEKNDDLEQLRKGLASMEENAARMPAQMKPALDLVIRRVQERIEILSESEKSGDQKTLKPEQQN